MFIHRCKWSHFLICNSRSQATSCSTHVCNAEKFEDFTSCRYNFQTDFVRTVISGLLIKREAWNDTEMFAFREDEKYWIHVARFSANNIAASLFSKIHGTERENDIGMGHGDTINKTIYNIRESTRRDSAEKRCLTYSIFMIPHRDGMDASRLNRDRGAP